MTTSRPSSVRSSAIDVTLARRVIGARTVTISWRGLPRIVVRDDGPGSRWRGTMLAPANRASVKVYRALRATQAWLGARSEPGLPPIGRAALEDAGLGELTPTSVIVGRPAPNQTVLAHLSGTSGRPVAVLKLPVRAGTNPGIAREIAALQDAGVQGRAPRLLATGTVDDRPYFVAEYVAGRTVTTARRGVQRAEAFLDLDDAAPSRHAAGHDHPWVRRVAVGAGLDPDVVGAAMAAERPVTRIHGDLAPWNLLVATGGRLVAIDWEESEADGLPSADIANFVMTCAFYVRGHAPEEAAAAAARTLEERRAIPKAEAWMTAALTAAWVCHRGDLAHAGGAGCDTWIEASRVAFERARAAL